MIKRPRRNRRSQAIRNLVQETHLHSSDFVAPMFITEGPTEELATLPGIKRYNINNCERQAEHLASLGVQAVALFPCIDPEKKDVEGSYALRADGLVPQAIRRIKMAVPELCLFGDVALDAYTSHSHDGLLIDGDVHNDLSVEVLAKQALVLAQAGIDVIAPSDMMDGRVAAIRKILALHDLDHVNICAYAAKFVSGFYGPYRDALGSSAVGDKKTYQLNPANKKEALLEGQLDVEEGADMLMVKPALAYLDIIAEYERRFDLPICAFQVTGEYAMVMAAHEAGMMDADRVFLETLLSIKRAGAKFIFTYAAERLLGNKDLATDTIQCSVAAHI